MSISVSFPSGRIFAKGNNKVVVTRTSELDDLTYSFHYGDITITRSFNSTSTLPATLVFPLDGIFEMILGDNKSVVINENELNISFEADSEYNPNKIEIVSGASFYPLASITAQGNELGFPQPKNIRIYPQFLPYSIPTAIKSVDSYLALTITYYVFDTEQEMRDSPDVGGGEYSFVRENNTSWLFTGVDFIPVLGGELRLHSNSNGNEAILTIEMLNYFKTLQGTQLTVESNLSALEYHPLSFIVDDCADIDKAVYVRWLDVYGYTLYFRFIQQDIQEESKEKQRISAYDSNVVKFDKSIKTWNRIYTLSSNLVDSETFDWLKRFPLGRDVQLYDGQGWRNAILDDVTTSHQDEMNALLVKLTIEEYTPNI